MRTIKFRGCEWNADNELLPFVYGKLCDVDVIRTIKGVDKVVHYKTVGQFTGLKDNNGKEVYEGDMLKVKDPYNDNWSTDSAEVIFSIAYVGGWVISNGKQNLNLGTRQKNLEIIGNIHENPELLK